MTYSGKKDILGKTNGHETCPLVSKIHRDDLVKNILHDLYRHERPHNRNSENISVNNKIRSEREYFEAKLSPDDVQRLHALENLYTEAGEFDETDAYIAGVKLGVMLMCAVFNDE